MISNKLKLKLTFALLPFGLLLIVISLYFMLRTPQQQTKQISMTAGSFAKTRHLLAQKIKQDANSENLQIQLQETVGSLEALDALDAGQLDAALVQGGIRVGSHKNVRQLATVTVEPLHLLVKEELYQAATENLSALSGKQIAVGKAGSGTRLLTTNVLEFAGLQPINRQNPDGDYQPVNDGYADLLETLQNLTEMEQSKKQQIISEMPDAIFVVNIVPSIVARELVQNAGYRLVPIKFGRAFSLSTVGSTNEEQTVGLSRLHITTTEIPGYTYDVTPPVPDTLCETLGTKLLLVAHRDLSADIAERLLRVLYEGPLDKLVHPPKISETLPEYPLHAGAIQYRDRDKPIIRGEIMEYFQKALGVIGPGIGGLLALWGFIRWRQTLKFEAYFRKICRISKIARGLETDPEAPPAGPALIEYLENELDELQHSAVEAYTSQAFHAESVMENLLALMSDVRISLQNIDVTQPQPIAKPPSPAEAVTETEVVESSVSDN